MKTNEDFLFAQEALRQGYVTEAQIDEGFLLQKRMADDLKLDERLAVILVKRGYLAEDQARRVYARIQPEKGQGEIRGYRLLDVVGRGAMGTVYKAIHLGLNREVALKILRPDLATDRTQVERLKAEAAMLASLDHPNVVRALDAGESNGFPYFVMEYVEGETLRDRLRREGRLAEDEALRIVRGLADALERARRMGIVHRDVKPGNVLLTRTGTPKLMDLGLAKGPIDLGLTQHGATVGTPQYIAPEQAMDPRKADTRSDIYGLGATLYAMLAGKPPFDGQTLAEIITKVLYETPVPVRTLRPEISPETGYLVERMMLRDPSLRYKTPLAVVQDIDRLMQGTSILPTGFAGNWEAYLLRRRARRLLTVYVPTVAAAVLLAAGWKVVQDRVRHGKQATVVEARIQDVLGETAVLPSDNEQAVRDRLQQARATLAASRDFAPDNLASLEVRVRQLEDEAARFDALEALLRDRVEVAAKGHRWADADEALAEFQREHPSTSPAVRAAERRAVEVRRLSDQFLGKARDERFPHRLESLAEAVSRLRNWRELVQDRYARTDYQRDALRKAGDAEREAAALEKEVREALEAVSAETLAALVEREDYTGIAQALVERRADAVEAVRRASTYLAPGFFSGTALAEIVRAAFNEAEAQGDDLLRDAWLRVLAEVDDLDRERRWDDAVRRLDAFVAATKDAWPLVADPAREKRQELERRTEAERREAERRWDALLADVLRKDLPAGDTRALRERVAAARAQPEFQPVGDRLRGLEIAAEAYDALVLRALEGIAARRGPDRERWLDTVRLRDGRRLRYLEVQGVDRDARTFTVVSHSGGKRGPVETWSVRDLADEQIAEFAGLAPGVARDQAMRAVQALAVFAFDEPDPFVLLDRWRETLKLLEAAGGALDPEGGAPSPLLAHARARVEDLARETAYVESLAQTAWKKSQEHRVASLWPEAYLNLNNLLEPPLRYARIAKEKAGDVATQIQEIESLMKGEKLALILIAKVSDPKANADGIRATITFDFDTAEQVRSELFPHGLARLGPRPPGGRPATPGKGGESLALWLNPGREAEATRDRPLVLALPLVASESMSVAFDLWVTTKPVFFGIDLQGAQAGILSADPFAEPWPAEVPRLDNEKKPPARNVYGRGRGVTFHSGPGFLDPADGRFDDPAAWPWDDGHQGRHFVDKEREARVRKDEMNRRWFAFEVRPSKPYRVVFERSGDRLSLRIDDEEVHAESRPEWKDLGSTGRIQLLSWFPCVIDDLQVVGRIPRAWFDEKAARLGHPSTGR